MFLQSRIKVFDLIMCLSNTIGLADPILVNHNKQVAYIALKIGQELGLITYKVPGIARSLSNIVLPAVVEDKFLLTAAFFIISSKSPQ